MPGLPVAASPAGDVLALGTDVEGAQFGSGSALAADLSPAEAPDPQSLWRAIS